MVATGRFDNNDITVIYQEVYGGKVTKASKQYTFSGKTGSRVFDIAVHTFDCYDNVLMLTIDKVSSWREHSNDNFLSVDDLHILCRYFKLDLVPYVNEVSGSMMPETLEEAYNYLCNGCYNSTRVGLDNDGSAEGIVIRSADRKSIGKMRFEDYEKTKKAGLIK